MSIDDYSSVYQQAAQQYNLDPNLLRAQGIVESSGDPNAYNSESKASGIAQIIPATAKSLGINPNDPTSAIFGQAKLMRENLDRYGDPERAVLAYHGGTDQSAWKDKTHAYGKKVMDQYQQLASNDVDDPLTAALLSRATSEKPQEHNEEDPLTQALLSRSQAHEQQKTENAPQKNETNTTQDVLSSVPSAIVKGVGAIPQIPAYAGNLAAKTEGYLYGKAHDLFSETPLTPEQKNKIENIQPFFTGNTLPDALIQSGKAAITGNPGAPNPLSGGVLYEPKTAPGRLTSAAIEGAIAGPATGAAGPIKSGLSALGGGVGNELYPNNPIATIAGGAIAPGISWAGNKLAGTTSPEMAEIAQAAKDRGVNIPPGLMSDSSLVNRGYSLLNRLGFTKDNTPQEFTGAVAKNLLGLEGTNKLTNPVMSEAKENITKGYGDVADLVEKSGGTKISDTTLNKIQEMRDNSVEASAPIEKFFNKLIDSLDEENSLTGAAYKKLTQTGSVIDNMQKSTKPEIKIAGNNLEKLLLDDLAESAGPDAKNLLQQTDKQYALWHLADAARDDTSGLISPAKFSSEAWKRNADYFKNQRNLKNPSETYQLSRIADQLKLTPSSGTAENLLLERLGGMAGSSLLGYGAAGGPGAAGAVAGGYALGKGAGHALSSDWYRNYLINKATGGSP